MSKIYRINAIDLARDFRYNHAESAVSYGYSSSEFLTSWWKFEELATIIENDTLIYDYATGNNHGVYRGAVENVTYSSAPGLASGAYFPGDVYAEFPDLGTIGLVDSDISIAMWVKIPAPAPGSVAADQVTLMLLGNNRVGIHFGADGSVHLYLGIIEGEDATSFVLKDRIDNLDINDNVIDVLADDEWHYIAYTYDSETFTNTLYLDGDSLGEYQEEELYANSDALKLSVLTYSSAGIDELVGTEDDVYVYPKFSISDLATWSTELSLEEIRAVYAMYTEMRAGRSGFMGYPARVLLNELDNSPNSYPTIKRADGDMGAGTDLVRPYDDSKTVVFDSAYANAWIYFYGRPRDASTITLHDPAGSIDLLPATATAWTALDDLTVSVNDELKVEQTYQVLSYKRSSITFADMASPHDSLPTADYPAMSGNWAGIKYVEDAGENIILEDPTSGGDDHHSWIGEEEGGMFCRVTVKTLGMPDSEDGATDEYISKFETLDGGGDKGLIIEALIPGVEIKFVHDTSAGTHGITINDQQITVTTDFTTLKVDDVITSINLHAAVDTQASLETDMNGDTVKFTAGSNFPGSLGNDVRIAMHAGGSLGDSLWNPLGILQIYYDPGVTTTNEMITFFQDPENGVITTGDVIITLEAGAGTGFVDNELVGTFPAASLSGGEVSVAALDLITASQMGTDANLSENDLDTAGTPGAFPAADFVSVGTSYVGTFDVALYRSTIADEIDTGSKLYELTDLAMDSEEQFLNDLAAAGDEIPAFDGLKISWPNPYNSDGGADTDLAGELEYAQAVNTLTANNYWDIRLSPPDKFIWRKANLEDYSGRRGTAWTDWYPGKETDGQWEYEGQYIGAGNVRREYVLKGLRYSKVDEDGYVVSDAFPLDTIDHISGSIPDSFSADVYIRGDISSSEDADSNYEEEYYELQFGFDKQIWHNIGTQFDFDHLKDAQKSPYDATASDGGTYEYSPYESDDVSGSPGEYAGRWSGPMAYAPFADGHKFTKAELQHVPKDENGDPLYDSMPDVPHLDDWTAWPSTHNDSNTIPTAATGIARAWSTDNTALSAQPTNSWNIPSYMMYQEARDIGLITQEEINAYIALGNQQYVSESSSGVKVWRKIRYEWDDPLFEGSVAVSDSADDNAYSLLTYTDDETEPGLTAEPDPTHILMGDIVYPTGDYTGLPVYAAATDRYDTDKYGPTQLYFRVKPGTKVSWGRCQIKVAAIFAGRFWHFDDIDNDSADGNNIRLNWENFVGHGWGLWTIRVEDSTKETFEFNRGRIVNPAYTAVNIRKIRKRDQINDTFARVVNESGLQIVAKSDGRNVLLTQTVPGAVGNLEIHADTRARCHISNSKLFKSGAVGEITGSFTGGDDYLVSYPTVLPARVHMTDPDGALLYSTAEGHVASAKAAGMSSSSAGLDSGGIRLYEDSSGAIVSSIDVGWAPTTITYYDDVPVAVATIDLTVPRNSPSWGLTFVGGATDLSAAVSYEATDTNDKTEDTFMSDAGYARSLLAEEDWLENEGLTNPVYIESPWLDHRIMSPNSQSLDPERALNSAGLITTGSCVKGVSDALLNFDAPMMDADRHFILDPLNPHRLHDDYVIKPYVDNKVDIDTENEFYDEGISHEIYEGLSSPLRSKTQIILDLETVSPTTLGYDIKQRYRDKKVQGVGFRRHRFDFFKENGHRWPIPAMPAISLSDELELTGETKNYFIFWGRGDIDGRSKIPAEEVYKITLRWSPPVAGQELWKSERDEFDSGRFYRYHRYVTPESMGWSGFVDADGDPATAAEAQSESDTNVGYAPQTTAEFFDSDWFKNNNSETYSLDQTHIPGTPIALPFTLGGPDQGMAPRQARGPYSYFDFRNPHAVIILPPGTVAGAGNDAAIDVLPGTEVNYGINQVYMRVWPKAYSFGSTTAVDPNDSRTKLFNNMAYYNFSTKEWDEIGPGITTQPQGADGHKEFFEDACIGFSRGIELIQTGTRAGALPITNFGFPTHPKFTALEEQTISMDQYIVRPFVLEKFVLEYEAAWAEGEDYSKRSVMYDVTSSGTLRRSDDDGNFNNKAAINSFFILNQRQWVGDYDYAADGQSETRWGIPHYSVNVTHTSSDNRHNRYMWDGQDYPYRKASDLVCWYRFNDAAGLFDVSTGTGPTLVHDTWSHANYTGPGSTVGRTDPAQSDSSPWELPDGVDTTDFDNSIELFGDNFLTASLGGTPGFLGTWTDFFETLEAGIDFETADGGKLHLDGLDPTTTVTFISDVAAVANIVIDYNPSTPDYQITIWNMSDVLISHLAAVINTDAGGVPTSDNILATVVAEGVITPADISAVPGFPTTPTTLSDEYALNPRLATDNTVQPTHGWTQGVEWRYIATEGYADVDGDGLPATTNALSHPAENVQFVQFTQRPDGTSFQPGEWTHAMVFHNADLKEDGATPGAGSPAPVSGTFARYNESFTGKRYLSYMFAQARMERYTYRDVLDMGADDTISRPYFGAYDSTDLFDAWSGWTDTTPYPDIASALVHYITSSYWYVPHTNKLIPSGSEPINDDDAIAQGWIVDGESWGSAPTEIAGGLDADGIIDWSVVASGGGIGKYIACVGSYDADDQVRASYLQDAAASKIYTVLPQLGEAPDISTTPRDGYGSEAIRLQISKTYKIDVDDESPTETFIDKFEPDRRWLDVAVHDPNYTKQGIWQSHATLIDPRTFFGRSWDLDTDEYYIRFYQEGATYPDAWAVTDIYTKESFSIGFWFKVNSISSGWSNLLTIADTTGTPNKIWIAFRKDSLRMAVDTGENRIRTIAKVSKNLGMEKGGWHFITFTFDQVSRTCRFYADGELIVSYAIPQKTDSQGELLWKSGDTEVTATEIDMPYDGTQTTEIADETVTLTEEEYMQMLGYPPATPWEFMPEDIVCFGADVDALSWKLAVKLETLTGASQYYDDTYAGTDGYRTSGAGTADVDYYDPFGIVPGSGTPAPTAWLGRKFDNYFTGNLSDIAVWKGVLNGLDIKGLYHLHKGGYYKKGLDTDISLAGNLPFRFEVPLDRDFTIRYPGAKEEGFTEFELAAGGNKKTDYNISSKLLARYLANPNEFDRLDSPDFRDVSIRDDLTGTIIGDINYSEDGPWIVPVEPADIHVPDGLKFAIDFEDDKDDSIRTIDAHVTLPRAKDFFIPTELTQISVDSKKIYRWLLWWSRSIAPSTVDVYEPKTFEAYPAFSVFAWIKIPDEQTVTDPVIFAINDKDGDNKLMFFIDTADNAGKGDSGDRLSLYIKSGRIDNRFFTDVDDDYSDGLVDLDDNTTSPAATNRAGSGRHSNWFKLSTAKWVNPEVADDHNLNTLRDGKWHFVGFTYTPGYSVELDDDGNPSGYPTDTFETEYAAQAAAAGKLGEYKIYIDGAVQELFKQSRIYVRGPLNDVWLHDFDYGLVPIDPDSAGFNRKGDAWENTHSFRDYVEGLYGKYGINVNFGDYEKYQWDVIDDGGDNNLVGVSNRHMSLEFDELDRLSLGQEYDIKRWKFSVTGKTYKFRVRSQIFNGQMADITMWNDGLTDDDVKVLYNTRFGTNEVTKWFNQFTATSRDLITYGHWSIYAGTTESSTDINDVLEAGLEREVTTLASMTEVDDDGIPTGLLTDHDGDPASEMIVSGSYIMEGIMKRPVRHEEGLAYKLGTKGGPYGYRSIYKTTHNGTRSGMVQDLSSARAIFNAVPGTDAHEPTEDFGREVRGRDSTPLRIFEEGKEESPYILYPTDRLVFGWQTAQPYSFKRVSDNGTGPHMTIAQNASEELPTKMKITLYGSYLSDGKETHDPLNQKLTSNALHEAMQFDAPVHDAFHLECAGYLAGTHRDDIVSGSIFIETREEEAPANVITRRRVASVSAGNQGITGSLLHGIRMADARERFYDTVVASPADYHEFNGNGILEWRHPLFMNGRRQYSLVFGEPRPSDQKVILPEKSIVRCRGDAWYEPVPRGVIKLVFRRLWTADYYYGDTDSSSDPIFWYISGAGYAQGTNYIYSSAAETLQYATGGRESYITIYDADNYSYAVWFNWGIADMESPDGTDSVIEVDLDLQGNSDWKDGGSGLATEGTTVPHYDTDNTSDVELPADTKFMSSSDFATATAKGIHASSAFEVLNYDESTYGVLDTGYTDGYGDTVSCIYVRTIAGGLDAPNLPFTEVLNLGIGVDADGNSETTLMPGGGLPNLHYAPPSTSGAYYMYRAYADYVSLYDEDIAESDTVVRGLGIISCEYQGFEDDQILMENDWGVAKSIKDYVSSDGSVDNAGIAATLGIMGEGVDDFIDTLRPNNESQFLRQAGVTETTNSFTRVAKYSLDGCYMQLHDAKDSPYNIWYMLDDGDDSPPASPAVEGNLITVSTIPPGSPASTVAKETAAAINEQAFDRFIATYEEGDEFFTVENVGDGSTKDADSTIMGLPTTTGFYLVDEDGVEYDDEFSYWAFSWGGTLGSFSFSKQVVDTEPYTGGNTPEDPEPYWHGDPIQEGVDPYHDNTNSLIDSLWLGSFPFEPRYASLGRRRWIRDDKTWNLVTWDSETGEFTETSRTATSFTSAIITGSNIPTQITDPSMDEGEETYQVLTLISDGSPKVTNSNLYRSGKTMNNFFKFYFGAGNTWQKNPEIQEEFIDSDGYSWPSAVPKIRGWKYGLKSAVPENSTAVFRHDSYGQYRDMLEQRRDSRFYKKLLRGRYAGFSFVARSAVYVRFVDQNGRLTQPDKTWSQNLSKFCTSSLPFFDDSTPRNREHPLNEDDLNTTIIAVGE